MAPPLQDRSLFCRRPAAHSRLHSSRSVAAPIEPSTSSTGSALQGVATKLFHPRTARCPRRTNRSKMSVYVTMTIRCVSPSVVIQLAGSCSVLCRSLPVIGSASCHRSIVGSGQLDPVARTLSQVGVRRSARTRGCQPPARHRRGRPRRRRTVRPAAPPAARLAECSQPERAPGPARRRHAAAGPMLQFLPMRRRRPALTDAQRDELTAVMTDSRPAPRSPE